MSNTWVRKTISTFCEMTKFEYSEVCLNLESCWPAKRERWWGVLTCPRIGKVSLAPLPQIQGNFAVSDLLPDWMDLPEEWLSKLSIHDNELAMFNQYSKGVDSLIVDVFDKLPTALHSWGSQTSACPCGCRGPFSHHRLQTRGIFGAIVREPLSDACKEGLRHLSPQEVALLNGYPRVAGWDHDPKLLLAGVGQLASPIHSAWIFAQVHRQLQNAGIKCRPAESNHAILARLFDDLFALRDFWFQQSPTTAMNLFQEKTPNSHM